MAVRQPLVLSSNRRRKHASGDILNDQAGSLGSLAAVAVVDPDAIALDFAAGGTRQKLTLVDDVPHDVVDIVWPALSGQLSLLIVNTSAVLQSPTWPASVDFGSFGEPSIVAGGSCQVVLHLDGAAGAVHATHDRPPVSALGLAAVRRVAALRAF